LSERTAIRPDTNQKAQKDSHSMRILTIDDDAFVLEILRGLAARAGYPEVTTALSAGAALEYITAAQQPFQCILLDIQMPVMDGIEFCDLLRRLPDYEDCPIIMVTAMTDRKFMDQAYAAGATDYVTKPFDVDDLTSRLGLAARSLD
jgi:CheY-like chemotaxis protein